MFNFDIMQNTVIINGAMMRPDCTSSSSKSIHWPLEDVVVSVKRTHQACYGLSSYPIKLRWMPRNMFDDKSAMVLVMAWCRRVISHYLSWCAPRSMLPYGITWTQWVYLWDALTSNGKINQSSWKLWECRIMIIKLDISYVNTIDHGFWSSFYNSCS